MAAAVIFPTNLPVPDPGTVKPVERRLVSTVPGLQQVRQVQADYLATQEVSWLLTAAQALILYDWWINTVLGGGLWFSADWPLPSGWSPATRRFIGELVWEHIPGGNWRVRGLTEIRGLNEAPLLEDPASTWNPDDMLTEHPPVPMVLTEDYRLATRVTRMDSYDCGVRGTKSHAASGKWYFELTIVSMGDGALPSDNQDVQFGILDATMLNEQHFPLNDSSNPKNTSTFVVCAGRFDGIVWSSYPTFNASPGTFTTRPNDDDVFGFAWEVGVNVKIYRNGVLGVTAALPSVAAMFPYFNAGSTNGNGPDTTDSGESVRLSTGRLQFSFNPPDGYSPWG